MSIPLHLITGFLGSGKTTFLKNYLDAFSGKRKIGIIQNEFSQLNVDSIELKQIDNRFNVLEINNGSVFCVCLLGSFIDSLAEFIDEYKPDEVLLEASGMSDPLSIGQILHAEKLKKKIYLNHVWCLVDAVNFEKISGLQTRIVHQVRIADTVILNKIDLADGKEDSLKGKIKAINPFARILPAKYANVAFETMRSVFKVFPPEESVESCRPELGSAVVKSNLKISVDNLKFYMQDVKNELIRCKGYVNVDSGKKILIQGTYSDYTFDEVPYFTAPSEFVVIGNFAHPEKYQNLFEEYCRL